MKLMCGQRKRARVGRQVQVHRMAAGCRTCPATGAPAVETATQDRDRLLTSSTTRYWDVENV